MKYIVKGLAFVFVLGRINNNQLVILHAGMANSEKL